MRWYLNDSSLQGQYADAEAFLAQLRRLMGVRLQYEQLRGNLYVTPTLGAREVCWGLSLMQALQRPNFRDQYALVLSWLHRSGPFIENDRLEEADDYFEFEGNDVTDAGLGEAARRIKAKQSVGAFSFPGGPLDFARTPLAVDHGLSGGRLGRYDVENHWTADSLRVAVENLTPNPRNWRDLIERARERFPRLWLPDSIYQNASLAREPFDSVISDQVLTLLSTLQDYMSARRPDGSEEPAAQEIIRKAFSGERAWFTGESETNRRAFKKAMTFPDPEDPGKALFCHWHGKISRRFFRLHFQWPVPAKANRLKVVYLGPKITKS